MKRILVLCLLIMGLPGCRARIEPPAAALPALIPLPLEVTVTGGRFAFGLEPEFLSAGAGACETDRQEAARLLGDFQEWLKKQGQAGSSSSPPAAGKTRATVVFAVEPGEMERLGGEGYSLRVTEAAVALRAARPAGIFYGMQTLRQLLLGQFTGGVRPPAPLSLPCLDIVDRPRYSWRGFMLDCCRHFFPKKFIMECLDQMALHKLNRFHWHLTEDQAWRVEVKKYPALAAKGGFRDEKGGLYGGSYSQEDVREIVAYAAERFITVVPEIEMPGHATAALSVYPDLSCTGGPFARMAQWGVFEDVYCAGSEKTFAFLQDVLDEVTELFPGPWVHVGGDECPKKRWNACPRCQERMRVEGLASAEELQSWFIRRVEKHLSSRGKRLIGWDEILEGGLAPEATVMSWRGLNGGIEAARQGHDVVMAPTTSAYLDYYQGDPRFEPPAIGGFLPLKIVYAFEPCPPELNAGEAARILGGQANLWTEYVAGPGHASYMMWPRLAALAEAVWSAPAIRDWDSFLLRLGKLRRGMKSMGMNVAETTWRPVITAKALPARRAWRIEMTGELSDAVIRYARGGFSPSHRSRLYSGPFECRHGGFIRAALFQGREPLAPAVELRLWKHLAAFATIRVSASGNLRPEKGGEALLVDGLGGSLFQQDGAWLGVEGGDLEAVIDLGRRHVVQRVAACFLEHPADWIFPPRSVEVAVSIDGAAWTPAAALDWPAADDFTTLARRDADLRFAARQARYIRVTARSVGICPPGHTGAGEKAWLFADEIAVE